MLVLSRKVGEKILIGDNISVTVVRITGGGVRLGIEAPTEMPVVREELKELMDKADNKLADKNSSNESTSSADADQPS